MDYKIVNGKVILPTPEEVHEEYLNDCRKEFVGKIDRACTFHETTVELAISKTPKKLIKEIKDAGYRIEQITEKYLSISWGEEE